MKQEIKELNDHNKQHGYKHRAQSKALETSLFKYKDLKQEPDKLDFVWYGFKAYDELLFPYVEALRKNNPSRRLLIIEHNSKTHHKARKLMAHRIDKLKIKFANHPAFSPDLNTIETLHREQKKPLKDFMFSVRNNTAEKRREAGSRLKSVWQGKSFDAKVIKYYSLKALDDLTIKCQLAHDHNNFRNQ